MAEDAAALMLNLLIGTVRKLKALIDKYSLDAEKHIEEVLQKMVL